MITGIVNSLEASVPLVVRGRNSEKQIEAVLDTGFNAWLSLPPAVITALELQWKSTGRGILADGSECLFDVFEGRVIWDGVEKRILIDESDADPLIGMALLSGFELRMEVTNGGIVSIERLSK